MNRIHRRTFMLSGGFGIAGLFGMRNAHGGTVARKAFRVKPPSRNFLSRLPNMMRLANVPGVAVGIVRDGELGWTGEFGVRDAGTKEPVAKDTVWQVGSLSKPVFTLSVMQLVWNGKLDLDRPLVDYLGGDIVKDDPRSRLITARHALSHSSGLQNWRFRPGDALQMSFAPGERWSYSGEGIYLVQRAIEQITGLGFEELVQTRALNPLGMLSSSYFWLPSYDKRVATAHNANGEVAVDYMVTNAPRMTKLADEWKKPVPTWRAEDFEKAQAAAETRFPPFPTFYSVNAAGTLFSTISDYAKFIASVIDRKFDEMYKPQRTINDSVSWGLGWGLQTASGSTQFWHWGEGINYRTFVIGDRESRNALLVFTNARNGRKIWERIVMESAGDQPVMLWL